LVNESSIILVYVVLALDTFINVELIGDSERFRVGVACGYNNVVCESNSLVTIDMAKIGVLSSCTSIVNVFYVFNNFQWYLSFTHTVTP